MTFTRGALALLGLMALTGMTALAQSISIGAGAQASGATQVSAPPVNVPPVNAPPVNAPPVNAPPVNAPPVNAPSVNAPPVNVPPANSNANANAGVKAGASPAMDTDGVLNGTLVGVTSSSATVRLSNGTTQNYAVSATTAQELRAAVGKPIAYRLHDGAMILAGNEGRPLRGTLQSLTASTAIIRLVNGTTQTYSVTSQQYALLKGRVGKTIVFRTGANGALELNGKARGYHRSR